MTSIKQSLGAIRVFDTTGHRKLILVYKYSLGHLVLIPTHSQFMESSIGHPPKIGCP
jgi:hypothetical protein